ncbi:MAG: DJ-1/PfpI family protein [Oscillospiraceae bacterium]|nr:DJ-1/PfpI family protein [Oscillospiraceae bacterium]
MLYLFLAEGFEEIEALSTLDVLRRAQIPVKIVGVGGKIISGAHKLKVMTDEHDVSSDFSHLEGVILPGGMPGTTNLEGSEIVRSAVDFCASKLLLIAAICAAPSIIAHMGLLKGKKATCYPGFEGELSGAQVLSLSVCRDDNIITGRGPGSAIDFALEIVKYLKGDEEAKKIQQQIV